MIVHFKFISLIIECITNLSLVSIMQISFGSGFISPLIHYKPNYALQGIKKFNYILKEYKKGEPDEVLM